MNLTPKQFDVAFAEYQQWGPRKRIPIETRWLKILRGVAESEYAEIKAQCKEIENFAYNLAMRIQQDKTQFSNSKAKDDYGRMLLNAAMKSLGEKFPFLNKERINRTLNQAMYYSIK